MNHGSTNPIDQEMMPLLSNMSVLSLKTGSSGDTSRIGSSPSSQESWPKTSSSSESSRHTLSTNLSSRSQSSSQQEQRLSYEKKKIENIRRILRLNLPVHCPSTPAWERLAVSCFDQVEVWAKQCLENYQPHYYDYCLIHTKESIDCALGKRFMKDLEMEGLTGRSILDADIGENKLDFATKLIDGSTKVFVFHSPPLSVQGLHRLCFQDAILTKLEEPEWRTKLVPVFPSPFQLKKYYEKHPALKNKRRRELGLSTLVGLNLDDDFMIEKIRRSLTIDEQMRVVKKSKSAREDFEFFLKRRKQTIYEEIRNVILKMKQQFGDEDPSSYLTPICNELNSLASLSTTAAEVDQIINMNSCNDISIGPTFQFSINRLSDEDIY